MAENRGRDLPVSSLRRMSAQHREMQEVIKAGGWAICPPYSKDFGEAADYRP